MDPSLEIRVLGPLEVYVAGSEVTPTAPKQRALFAALLVEMDRVVSTDRLVDALWGEAPPATARSALSVHLTELRKHLGDAASRLQTRRPGYVFLTDDVSVDATEFERLVADGRAAFLEDSYEIATALLQRAEDLWRGPAFVDFEYADFVRVEASRLDEIRLACRTDRIDAELSLGRHSDLISELEAITKVSPQLQRSWAQLMLALYRAGRQRDALDAYQRAATWFAETGLDPGKELRRLEEQILLEDPQLDLHHSPAEPASNLPEPRSSFVGRGLELTEVAKRVSQNRLVTVTGPGGVGKTRLALEVARRLLPEFVGGVWLADLAALRGSEEVDTAIVRAVGSKRTSGAEQIADLADRLPDDKVLVVVDSIEHVSEACAAAVATLLDTCAQVTVLATGRAPLSLAGESVVWLTPLQIPECGSDVYSVETAMSYEGVRLFAERAQAVAPAFAVGEANVAAVVEICCRVDGLPLAIELGAAQIPFLGPGDILEHLNNRIELPARVTRDAPPRHQTLWGTMEWSYRLLAADAQKVFRRASVFDGSFSLAAARSVCSGDDLAEAVVTQLLAALVEASMVLSVDHDDANRRYAVLATLREFGGAKLDEQQEQDAAAARHREYYLGHALSRPGTQDKSEMDWFRTLEAELPEYLKATSGALTVRHRAAAEGYRAVARFLIDTARSREAQVLSTRALAVADGFDDMDRAVLLQTVGNVAFFDGDWERAERYLRMAVEIRRQVGTPEETMTTLNSLGIALIRTSRVVDTRAAFTEAIDIGEELGDRVAAASPTLNLGISFLLSGPPERAAPYLSDSLLVLRQAGNELGTSIALAWLAAEQWLNGDHEHAIDLCEESIAIQRRFNARGFLARNLAQRAALALDVTKFDEARSFLAESFGFYQVTAERLHYAEMIETCGYLVARSGPDSVAAELLGAADVRRTQMGIGTPLWDRRRRMDIERDLVDRLGGEAYAASYRRGSLRSRPSVAALVQHSVKSGRP